MKKKFFEKNLILILFSLIALLFASCGNLAGGDEETYSAKNGEGSIRISLGDNARTAYPIIGNYDEWTWTLKGLCTESTYGETLNEWKTLKVWKAGSNAENEDAIKKPVGVKAGKWNFSLTAEKIESLGDEASGKTEKTLTTYSAIGTYTDTQQVTSNTIEIQDGEATLTVDFKLVLTQLDTSVEGKGSFEISVDYTSSAVAKITAALFKAPTFTGGEASPLVEVTASDGEDSDKYKAQDITAKKVYSLTEVPAGNYVAAFYFYDKDGNPLNARGYEEYVYVAKDCHSKSEVKVASLDDVYSITYIPAPSVTTTGSFTRHTQNISLPTAKNADGNLLDTDSKLFCGWYESSDYSGQPVLEIPMGSRGDKVFYGKYISASEAKALGDLSLTYSNALAESNENKYSAQVGNTVKLASSPEATCSYQWFEEVDANSSLVSGATASSYKITGNNIGKKLSLLVKKTYKVEDYSGSGTYVLYHTVSEENTEEKSVSLMEGEAGEEVAVVKEGTLDLSSVTIQYSGKVIVGNKPEKKNLIISGILKDIYGNTISSSDLAGDFEDYAALSASKTLKISVTVEGYKLSENDSSASVYVTVQHPAPTGAELRKITDSLLEGEIALAEGNVAFTKDTVAMGLQYSTDGTNWNTLTSDQFAKPAKLLVRYGPTPPDGTAGEDGYIMASSSASVAITAANVGTAESESASDPGSITVTEKVLLMSGPEINNIFTTSFKTVTKFAYTTDTASSSAVTISAADSTIEVKAWKSGPTSSSTLYVTASGYSDPIPLPADSSKMFANMARLTSIDLSNFKLDVTDDTVEYNLSEMFAGCTRLTTIIFGDNFNTSLVTNMSGMFHETEALVSLDVSKFNTSKVTDMSLMFAASALTGLDLSSFDTSSVTDMSSMFQESYLENVNFGNKFDTSKVAKMSSMFAYTALQELDLSAFDTSAVTEMNSMFFGMSDVTTINLSGSFVVTSVTDADYMFADCSSLSKIYVAEGSNWAGSVIVGENQTERSGQDMFLGCENLVGGRGTVYTEGNYDIAYAHVDLLSNNPGYFTVAASGN